MCLQPLSITLRGITNAAADPSVDVWRTVTLPLLRQATGLSEGFELKIIKRGAEPLVCGPASCHALISTPRNTSTHSCTAALHLAMICWLFTEHLPCSHVDLNS